MLGQNHHFRLYAPEKLPYAIDRYTNEARRLYGLIDRQLARINGNMREPNSVGTTPRPVRSNIRSPQSRS